MSLFSSLTTSLDDVVFEGRNQAYGAYQLRQDYRQHLAKAGALTLGLGLLLWLVGLAWPAAKAAPDSGIISCPMEPLDIQLTKVIEKPRLLPATPHRARAATSHVAAPAIPTEISKNDAPQPLRQPTPAVEPIDEPTGPVAAGPGVTTGPPTGPVTGPPTGGESAGTESESSAPFVYVEKMPEFAGGQAALLRYLSKNLHYPPAALRDQIEGKVFLSFVVKADGTIADATILRGLRREMDDEALRVVRQMPAWTPGYQSKRAVAVRFTLPITFQIQ